MNQLTTERRAAVVAALVEGNSLRATSRITGVARMTVEKLLRDLGTACMAYHDANVRNLKSQRIQCDEIWCFVGAKAKNVPEEKKGEWGDCWTWTALDPDSKLIVSYSVGTRTQSVAYDFMKDVASRLVNRVQLTTDGWLHYLTAVEYAFGSDVDYAMMMKKFATPGHNVRTGRYSPSILQAATRTVVTGDPNYRHISTSHVERQNLTMRMHMRRFTRLTNGFSKKIEMHAYAVALHFMHYNFCKIHQTLRVTPAMEAGLADHAWDTDELIALLATSHPRSVPAA
jgi:IS1 family transposase